ncbi:MAG: hypothetical protein HYZ71_13585 [Deltaproteobacteria bacterium]|nr:hypothetical protein [Deltaproteobacteria bacterium]
MKFLASPVYVAVLVGGLVVLQLNSTRLQFERGFRLFGAPPGRVAFSWDMFATRVERCQLSWDPPVATELGEFSSLRRFGTSLEWDIIYDTARDYHAVGQLVCRLRSSPEARHRVKFHCFSPDGTHAEEEVPCG